MHPRELGLLAYLERECETRWTCTLYHDIPGETTVCAVVRLRIGNAVEVKQAEDCRFSEDTLADAAETALRGFLTACKMLQRNPHALFAELLKAPDRCREVI